MDPTFPLVPIANLIGCILVLISLSKGMLQSWNVGACSFAFWTFILNLELGVNSIVWSDNTDNVAPVWCDIMTHIGIVSIIGSPASSFVIIRRLSIMLRRDDGGSLKNRRGDLITDLFFCVGCPLIQMVLYYIVQEVRFEIFEEVGCLGSYGSFGLSVLLLDTGPLLFPLASLVLYSPRLIFTYFRHRRQIDETLAGDTTVNRSVFTRLLVLGLFDILMTLPIVVLNLAESLLENEIIGFWPGWSVAHADIATVQTVSAAEWKSAGAWTIFTVKFDEWINPIFALAFFLLFGLTETKRTQYRDLFWRIAGVLGLRSGVEPDASAIVFVSNNVADPGVSELEEIAAINGSKASVHSYPSPGRVSQFESATKVEEARCSVKGNTTTSTTDSIETIE